MVKSVEAKGESIEAAVANALAQLGKERDDVTVEVLEKGKNGFFGIGAQPAKVRVYQESSDKAEIAVAYIKDILTEIGLPHVEVTAKVEENNNAVITLSGEGLGVIIGRRGETLDALQYLTGLVANRADGDYTVSYTHLSMVSRIISLCSLMAPSLYGRLFRLQPHR